MYDFDERKQKQFQFHERAREGGREGRDCLSTAVSARRRFCLFVRSSECNEALLVMKYQ